jgi:hypothetical protein
MPDLRKLRRRAEVGAIVAVNLAVPMLSGELTQATPILRGSGRFPLRIDWSSTAARCPL